MAVNILDRYGIKEVADVTFYKLIEDEVTHEVKPGAPVLYLDTLKVSTTEQTAENTSARGGKGNPELIMWDYGKEITVNLEDALFSTKSMAIMYGSVDSEGEAVINDSLELLKTVFPSAYNKDAGTFTVNGKDFKVKDVVEYNALGQDITAEGVTDKNIVYVTGTVSVAGTEVVISSDSFPGTYYVTGDTYARSENTGEDEFFQFIIPKAKVLSEVTLTMEAEGDSSTFSMNLKVLRPKNGQMMKLIKYNLLSSDESQPEAGE